MARNPDSSLEPCFFPVTITPLQFFPVEDTLFKAFAYCGLRSLAKQYKLFFPFTPNSVSVFLFGIRCTEAEFQPHSFIGKKQHF